MDSADLHEVAFEWPHPEPNTVVVTGTFDQWSKSIHLVKTPKGFKGAVRVPWNEKIKYKFIVDGQWSLHEGYPTETDPGGYVNNVYTAPSKPAPPTLQVPPAVLPAEVVQPTSRDTHSPPITLNGSAKASNTVSAKGQQLQSAASTVTSSIPTTLENGKSLVADASQKVHDAVVAPASEALAGAAGTVKSAVQTRAADSKVASDVASSEPKTEATISKRLSQFLSGIANTVVAADGTSSALGYVTSGLGVAVQNIIGIDPINSDPIAVPPTPKVEKAIDSPSPVEGRYPSSVAPDVPISIVPVNAPENNTISLALSSPVPKEEAIGAVSPSIFSPAIDPVDKDAAPVADIPPTQEEPSTHAAVVAETSEAETPAVGGLGSTAESDVPSPKSKAAEIAVVEPVSEPAAAAPVEVKAEEPVVSVPVETKTEEPKVAAGQPTAPAPESPKAEEAVAETPSPKAAPPAPLPLPTPTTPPKAEEKPVTNGHSSPRASASSPPSTPSKEKAAEVSSPNTPSTPTKRFFPRRSESPSISGSPSGTVSSRKKRNSIFGKVKELFHHEKKEHK
ncbi:hypothetical protein BDQ12DRAFT_709079 [Crucibulum laeve]|uniref:AMP-activated protein kinase glycogen-binding domain-containing protein n=1 Tax=Crucibulum laeve TaxID=68775 RepID=A0A5C3MEC4_9AGAR|nr:hypothetical protein BDQ12DRAFT_709079 [Crucibulum laeve]